jgi:exopolyphosphatase/guanosine-5'-triphosphate,3'-diphosphate pyrophosphatase
MKLAALDLGSNSFLCLVAETDSNGILKTLSDQVEIVRLGKNLESQKSFDPQALIRAQETLARFKIQIDKFKPDIITAVATAAARKVSDPSPLINICQLLQIPVQIISGSEEARLTYLGAAADFLSHGKLAIIDIGGGSTEIVLGKGASIEFSISVPIGAVNLTEKLDLADLKNRDPIKIRSTLDSLFSAAFQKITDTSERKLIAVAGTPTELARAEIGTFDFDKINGYQFSAEWLQSKTQQLQLLNPQQTIEIGIDKGRADIIFAGATILSYLLDKFAQQKLSVSTKGLRYGLALDIINRSQHVSNS